MFDELLLELSERDVKAGINAEIGLRSSIGIKTSVSLLIEPDNEEGLLYALRLLRNRGADYVTVGRMSNLLFREKEYGGIALSTSGTVGCSIENNTVRASAGERIASVLSRCARLGLGGAEQLWNIPGSIGGAVYSNAGAFGLELSDIFLDCECFDKSTGECVTLCREDMNFSYRRSVLCEGRFILLSARLALKSMQSSEIIGKVRGYAEKRRRSQPSEPSLGSVFKRVNQASAGYYIEKCGLKGYRIGGACFSTKHAGFIVNDEGALGEDVFALVRLAQREVLRKFGVHLEPEIVII